jgi:DNA modification methylase|tara:strand:+ start:1788 stop:2645 length:858 start_codon:yes stop_codon:yes gene_type:complete
MKRKNRNKHRVRDEVRKNREEGIREFVCNDNERPILTSVWLPSKEQISEVAHTPFYKAVKFTGRTFPHVIRKLVLLYSDEGGLVYDPMLGSGTTLYEGQKLNRVVMGSDLNKNTVENFKERWKKYNRKEPLPKVRKADASRLIHLDSDSVDLIIMSFPWFTSWKFGENKKTTSMENNENMKSFMKQSLLIYKECRRVLKVGGYVCNILGNTYIKGEYYPITMKMTRVIERADLSPHYQFWNLRVDSDVIKEPWSRSGLDINIKKADNGVGWDIHEDIIIARKVDA